MNEGIKKFEELLKTDEVFQKKLADAAQAYKGEMTQEAIFNNVLVPFASEYGITATFDELNDYLEGLVNNQEMDENELKQVAGGKNPSDAYGMGLTFCAYAGVGIGGSGDGKGNVGACVGVGGGSSVGGGMSCCVGLGSNAS